MTREKKNQIAEALSGISYADWSEISMAIEKSYHVTKKELTFEEVNSHINAFPLPSDD